MSKLNLYYINNVYINYLQQEEWKVRGFTNVSNNIDIDYTNFKPYIGVILQIEKCNYFVSLTHPKQHYDDNAQFFNRISHSIKLTNGKKYGWLMFCYMIPIKDEHLIHWSNINNIEDNNYKNILMSQYFYLKSPEKKKSS